MAAAQSNVDKVFVVLPTRYEDGLPVLSWVLTRFPRDKTKIIITHVKNNIIFRGLDDSRLWLSEMDSALEKYMAYCSNKQFRAEKLVHMADNIADGILQVIAKHGTKNLVMRSDADSCRNMTDLASDTAKKVMKEASQSCKLWFVSDGNLICTREVNSSKLTPASTPRQRSRSNAQLMEGSSSTSAISNSIVEKHIDEDASLIEILHEASEADNFRKMADKMAQLVPKLVNKLLEKEQKIGELREILKMETQEKEQLRQEIEEIRHMNLRGEEIEQLRKERDEYLNQIQVANERNHGLRREISNLETSIKDLNAIRASEEDRINALQTEWDDFARQNAKLCIKQANIPGSSMSLNFEFSLQELQQATLNFSELLKIGEGAGGSVYKGSLHQTNVAIKLLHNQRPQSIEQFQQETVVLTNVRHPNLVNLVGACTEKPALVYEYLSNGSLEDRLTCANSTPPLTWQARTRIIGEICLALIFLHSNKPHLVVHGDLKPQNILLDTNLVSKLSDFGISCLMEQPDTNTTAFLQTGHPAGTFSYVDPEYISTGTLTPKSDIYSFGIIILRVLTGKPPLNIARQVQDALRDGILLSVIDESAGTWPFEQATQLAQIALRCAEITRDRRPDLVTDVWKVIEPLMKAALTFVEPQSHASEPGEENIPSQFICPILQEVMKDPYIAADGFTYEADAIREWLRNHNTSPMTNLQLPHCNLIPNHVLRSTIQDWLQKHPQ